MRTSAKNGLGLVRFVSSHPGLRGARLSAFRRAVVWQLAKRLGARRARISVGPAQMYCYPGSTGASGVLYTGLPEWDDMLFAIGYLRSGERFIDVGANVGAYSVLVGSYRPGVSITAVEPDREARNRLAENLALNELAAEVIPAALAEEPGQARFTSGLDSTNHLAVSASEEAVDVEVRTLDAVAGDRRVSLVKIDVEGAELAVLRGGHRLLSRPDAPPVLFELNGQSEQYGVSVPAIRDHLGALGYSLFFHVAQRGGLAPFSGEEPPPSGNVIATKDPEAVASRLVAGEGSNVVGVPVRVSMSIEGTS